MAATLKEIAEATGMSIRSVSRALRGIGGISGEKSKFIRDKAAELGYIPNIAARNLRMKRRNVVGMIAGPSSGEVFGKKNLAIQRKLESRGLFPLLGFCHRDSEAMSRMLGEWTGMVNKVICLSWHENLNYRSFADSFGLEFIFIDCRVSGDEKCSRIEVDRAGGVGEAARCFYDNSRRHIIRCGRVANRKGFEQVLAGIDVRSSLIASDGIEFADGYAAGPKIIDSKADAVFFDTDRMALGFYRYAHESGIKIPQDIAVAGFDDDGAGRFASPALSSVAHPIEEIAVAAVKLVLAEQPSSVMFPTKFIRRESI